MSSPESTPFFRALPFQFTGTGPEYFKIWIVNLCLSIVTLGIYSAWAKVRRLRYFYGNTWLDEHSFSYLADPVKILKGRLLAVAFLVIYSLSWDFYPKAGLGLLAIGLLLLPFILVAAVAFQMRYSSYRNIRFYLDRDYAGAYRMFVIPFAIILLLTWGGYSLLDISDWFTNVENEEGQKIELSKNDFIPTLFFLALMPLLPYLDYLRTRFIISRTYFGHKDARFKAGAWSFYKIYIIALLLLIVVFILAMFFIGLLSFVYMLIIGKDNAGSMGYIWPLVVIIMLIFYSFLFLVGGYLHARRTNLIYDNISFEGMRLRSYLKVFPVSWIQFSNMIAIIFSLGMLIPWTKIRMARYVASCTELEAKSLDDVAAASRDERSALGEEMVDSFDIDIGL